MPQDTDAAHAARRSRCRARAGQGADAADAVLFEGAALSHAQRLERIEKLERSESFDIGLRVIVGQRQATVSAERAQQPSGSTRS